MGINQAIFTSSARGIARGGGLGIYSFNKRCSQKELAEFQKGFCSYPYCGDSARIPMLPRKMLYKKIDESRYMQASVTYLGQDYMKGQGGRMSNLLSHMLSFEKEDIKAYPIQLYGSPDFRYEMKEWEVDGSRSVTYLDEVRQACPGSMVTAEKVQDFLNEKSFRKNFLRHLLAAVFHMDSTRKVIICDTHENIIMWLAAIQYALPLQCAIELSFSSCEENPMMSAFDIRGAVLGLSRGSSREYAAGGQHFVFDGIAKTYPEISVSDDYFQFGFAYGFEAMQGFFEFMKRYDYASPNMDLCAGYDLYQMLQGGMELLSEEQFQKAVAFEAKYGSGGTYRRILENLLNKLENGGKLDAALFEKFCFWLEGFFGKDLESFEWEFAISCAARAQRVGGKTASLAKDRMWQALFDGIMQGGKDSVPFLVKRLETDGLYGRLGEFSGYLAKKTNAKPSAKFLERLFNQIWAAVPQAEYRHFDLAVQAEADLIETFEEQERYLESASMFLILQEAGNGEIFGSGMEKLIGFIADGTDFQNLKPRRQGILHRKKEESKESETLQAKCAFEAFNYAQRHNKDLEIAKIRLMHLGREILNAFESGAALEKSRALQIYSEYPVDTGRMRGEEFRAFLRTLCETIYEWDVGAEDYRQLLLYYILDESRKKIMLQMFLSYEMENMKKEGQITGLASLLAAVRALGDAEYGDALKASVMELRESQKEKAAGMMEKKWGRQSKVFQFWKELCAQGVQPLKSSKKRFGKFGR